MNGGSYTVAKENIGQWPGLLAAAALMTDYVLNAAVGISAGVAALVSAAPSLHRYTLPMCLGILAVITIINLRGTSEAGLAFALPAYLFIGTLLAVIGIGLFRVAVAKGHPHPVVAPPTLPPAVPQTAVLWWLLLRSFASGCTAMTGVEAVSNGVSAFKDPAVKTAHRTLTIIVVVLAMLLAGVALLARAYGIGAMDQSKPGYQSVVAQIVGAVVGHNWFYYTTIASVLATLCLAANTSFIGFPRLCRLIADDDFLPRAFAIVGRRLVLTVGILFLTGAAAALLIVFRGITEKLIPLYAVGAFLAFTLSQSGMVLHWRREGGGGKKLKMTVNGVGAIATGTALIVILAAKFVEGAWITVIMIPAMLALFWLVHRRYAKTNAQTRTTSAMNLSQNEPPVVMVPINGWDRPANKAMRFGMWLSKDVIGVHLLNLNGDARKDEAERAKRDWATNVEAPAKAAGGTVPRLVVMECPYRDLMNTFLKQVDRVKADFPNRVVAVIVPELVGHHWWDWVLHRRKASRLRKVLIRRGDHRVVVVTVPWYLED